MPPSASAPESGRWAVSWRQTLTHWQGVVRGLRRLTNKVNVRPLEKRVPHCPLPQVKALVEGGRVRATASAYVGARSLGIDDLAGMCAVVAALAPGDFYKSMTTHANHRVWQDVYHFTLPDGVRSYLKLTVVDDLLIVSFKEL